MKRLLPAEQKYIGLTTTTNWLSKSFYKEFTVKQTFMSLDKLSVVANDPSFCTHILCKNHLNFDDYLVLWNSKKSHSHKHVCCLKSSASIWNNLSTNSSLKIISTSLFGINRVCNNDFYLSDSEDFIGRLKWRFWLVGERYRWIVGGCKAY